MCKFCGTRYCSDCLRGDFYGLMKAPDHCRKCNQVKRFIFVLKWFCNFYFRQNVKENVLKLLYLLLVQNQKLLKNLAKVEKVQARAKHREEKNPKRKNDK